MDKEIISDYINENISIEKLALKYKIGKIKIKNILCNNNIDIKKRGGQQKHNIVPFKYDLTNKNLKCKSCGKIFNDIDNKSGSLTDHMKICYPNIVIPSKLFRYNYKKINGEYWHFQFFDIIEKEDVNVFKCPDCDWKTKDLTNKTGSFTKHVIKEHGSIEQFILIHPDYSEYFNNIIKKIDYNQKTQICDDNFVICRICGKKMRVITNTHLKKHNTNCHDYKLKYPNDNLSSKKNIDIFRKNAILGNINIEPVWTSKGEIEILNFINGLGINAEKSKNRKLLNGKEIDIVINTHNICIEYNGLYYHTERMGKNSTYHLNKTKECNNIGYGLIHIFEDEWINSKDIVKTKIKHLLNVNYGIKIGARNTVIKFITTKEKSDFLKENHIQGNDRSKIYYGAYYNDILVGVMTFNNKRNMTKNLESEYELSRFCIKQNFIVSGLSSKILKQFIIDFSPKSIISFADRRWTINYNDNLYTKLGFKLIKILKPSYTYYNSKINKYKRFHKFGFGKKNIKKKYPNIDINKSENKLMVELGYDKIWDCGLFKYQLLL